jgi:multidrug transporter EmrE-like cation transporter
MDELETIVFNYLFASGWGILIWNETFTIQEIIAKPWFVLSLVIGVLFVVTFFLLSRSTISVGLAVTAVASRMSVLIPVVAGFLLFGDVVSGLKILGILLAMISFYLIFKPDGQPQINVSRILMPFLLFLGIGANDTIMKYIQFHYLDGDETLLLTNVFFISLVIGSIILLFRNIWIRKQLSYKSVFAGFLLGSFNFAATYFFIRSMIQYESALLFPAVNVGIVALTALLGLVFFKENLSRLNWIGIFTAIIAIVIISKG